MTDLIIALVCAVMFVIGFIIGVDFPRTHPGAVPRRRRANRPGDDVRHIAVQVTHAAAQEAVHAMGPGRFRAWLHELGLAEHLSAPLVDELWEQVEAILPDALVTVTYPRLYQGVGDPAGVPDRDEGERS